MADLKEDRIDFGKLEKELFAAVQADEAYWRENDAKLRAMDQRVESYDQFRDMVAAAHIKPLDKKDKISQGKRNQPWNPFSNTNSSSTSIAPRPDSDSSLDSAKELTIPKNGHDFSKLWKKKSSPERYTYLLDLGSKNLSKIFRAEISFGLLGELVAVLHEQSDAKDCGKVFEILESLPRAGRFGLSLDFLSKMEKQMLIDLIVKLERWTADEDTNSMPRRADENIDNDVSKKEIKEDMVTVVSEGVETKTEEKENYDLAGSDLCSENVNVGDKHGTRPLTENDFALLRDMYNLTL